MFYSIWDTYHSDMPYLYYLFIDFLFLTLLLTNSAMDPQSPPFMLQSTVWPGYKLKFNFLKDIMSDLL